MPSTEAMLTELYRFTNLRLQTLAVFGCLWRINGRYLHNQINAVLKLQDLPECVT